MENKFVDVAGLNLLGLNFWYSESQIADRFGNFD